MSFYYMRVTLLPPCISDLPTLLMPDSIVCITRETNKCNCLITRKYPWMKEPDLLVSALLTRPAPTCRIAINQALSIDLCLRRDVQAGNESC
jgi:hypothetical protein